MTLCFLFGAPLGQRAEAAVQGVEQIAGVQDKEGAIAPAASEKGDPNGLGMAIVAMGAVFFGLICLYLVFKVSDKVAFSLSKKRVMKISGFSKEEAKSRAAEPGEVFAAIAMALEEISEEDHDDENMVLTLKNVARSYSPWSSKIYTLRELPRR